MVSALPWLAENFCHPERVGLPTGHHLRPIRESDVDIDYPAVMISRERLWATGGELERALDEFVPRWLTERWGFRAVRYAP